MRDIRRKNGFFSRSSSRLLKREKVFDELMKRILSADIGGTNSRFAYFEGGGDGRLKLAGTQWLKTADFSSFVALVDHLRNSGFPLRPEEADIAVFAVAGPVEGGTRSSPPFISWDVDLLRVKEHVRLRKGILINDFVAQAYACRSPVGEAAEEVLQGTIVPDAAAAVIGAGTALGKAALVPLKGNRFQAVPSEGGHTNFPFVSKDEIKFGEFLLGQLGDEYITGNIVVSGRGLSYIHEFLSGEKLHPDEIAATISRDSETLVWASRFYGRACRNYALDVLALGGVYIAGGVAAKMPQLVKHGAFGAEFRSSSTMGHLLKKIPVFLITNEESGLWGGAVLGLQEITGA
jgi:glucokinase